MTGPEAGHAPLTLVTGGSRGIGHFLVQAFLDETDVLNVSRGPARRTVPGARHALYNLSLDLGNVAEAERGLCAWFEEHPHHEVRTLIHNAAVLNPGWLDKVSAEQIDQSFRVNVHAPLAMTTALFRAGRFSGLGARVAYVVSSLARPLPGLSFAGAGLYSMTKAALSRMALVQSREFALAAPHIGVLRVHPGIVDTDLQRELRADPAALDSAFAEKTAGLPPYHDGEWDDRSPKDHMRTISPQFAAEFVAWAVRRPEVHVDEYDFYETEEFHKARRLQRSR